MSTAEDRLVEAEAVTHQLEAVLEAAARMAAPFNTPDFERAAWLNALALELSQRLLRELYGSYASEGHAA